MPGSTKARVKNWPSTPAASTVAPGVEVLVDAEDLEIDAAGIQLLIEFFLQLKKWDKLQSTRTPFGVPESFEGIAA
jgi:hypothetical protein